MKPIDIKENNNPIESAQFGNNPDEPLSDKANVQVSDKISDEATQWLLTMEEDDSLSNQQALDVWLSVSSQHKKAYQQLQTLWQLADELPVDLFSEDLVGLSLTPSSAVNSSVVNSSAVNAPSRVNLNALRKESVLAKFIAFFTLRKTMYTASFASVIFAAFFTFTQYNQEMVTIDKPLQAASSNSLRTNEYQTQLGEHKTITAPDGSIIVLAAKSQVFIDYSANRRDIHLLYGEALFTVEKDKKRPFIVHNHGRSVQALGTIFNVRESKNSMQVSVLEGIVEVSVAPELKSKIKPEVTNGSDKTKITTLVAGQALELDSLSQLSTTYAIEVNERMAWQDGRLNYVNTDLANVIFDLKRYSTLSIHIPNKQVANMGYTGSVIYDKVDDWLIALPYIFPVEVQRHGDSVVIVKREG